MRPLMLVTGLLALLLILLPGRWAGRPASTGAAAHPSGGALAPPEASVTPTCAVPSGYRLLIVYADSAPPTTLRAALLAQPGVGAVDFFDAAAGTPPAAQLSLYHAVVVFSSVNHDYQDPVALGDRLADYQDAGGVVLADYGSFFAFGAGGIRGRWLSQGYAPFTYTIRLDGSAVHLGAYDPTHPLMAGVGTLDATLRPDVSLAPGATLVASYSDGSAALAVQGPPSHPSVGLTAYLGEDPGAGTGDYARVIANGVRWLLPTLPCSTATATGTPPTATGTATPSRTPTTPPTTPPSATPVPPTATRTPVVGVPTPVCAPAWQLSAPAPATPPAHLEGIAVRAADDAWAVGTQYTTTVHGSYDVVLLQHWDGTAWQVVPGANPGEFGDHLAAVTALAPDNAWAVGDQTTASPGQILTLIEHWDGTRWQAVPSANPNYTVNALEAIAAAAPNDLWAVGYFNDAPGDAALLEHWDGTAWTPAYVLPELLSRLHGVALRTSADGWAVGACACGGGGTNATLILHWDGSAWGRVPSPNVGAGDNELLQVAALAADDVWAVGDYGTGQGDRTLIEHWDGQSWSVVPSPPASGDSDQLRGLTALGPTDLWAVGSSVRGAVMRPLALHWDGQQWTPAALPDVSGPYVTLGGVSGAAPADVWASGADGARGQPLILHYTGAACPPSTATATTTTAPPAPSATLPLPTRTPVPVPSATATPTTPAPSATPCALAFRDVAPGDYFAAPVADLACRGVLSGYADGTFRPYSNTTRAQMVKIVILGFHPVLVTPAGGGYTFADVPSTHPFFAVIETAAAAGLVSGYGCGGPGEPCDAQQRAYFRPYAPVTRGQLSKITVLGAGWPLRAPAVPSFLDVPVGAPFYAAVETAHCAGLLSGYADGTFRPGNAATRGQIAKIVDLALTGPGPCAPLAGPAVARRAPRRASGSARDSAL